MKKYFLALALALKIAAYALVGIALGYIIGDEIEQRKLRADLRSLCAEEFVARMGEPENEMAELIVAYQCRNAIP
jgi:hypothetical protein